ncbi:MAG: HDOD domain-containing protein [Ectothiorhodospiraceae bacterium]
MAERPDLLAAASLPSLPYVSHEILLEVNAEEADISRLTTALSRDPALAARIVSTANSAFFAGHGSVTGLEPAVMRLGLDRLRVLATSVLLRNQFDASRCPGFRPEAYWQRAIATANATGRLARAAGLDPAPGQLAGLLHSIGVLLLAHCFPQDMATVFAEHRRAPEAGLARLTRDRLDVDHHEAGGLLLREWELPVSTCALVEGLGSPRAHLDPGLLGLLRAATDWAAEGFEGVPEALTNRGLAEGDLDRVARQCRREHEETRALAQLLAQ